MTQIIIVAILIIGAVLFLGLRAYRSWAGKKSEGCEKCGTMSPSVSNRTVKSHKAHKVGDLPQSREDHKE